MLGDSADFVWRMLCVLPRGWFAEPAPPTTSFVQTLLSMFGYAWSQIFALVTQVQLLARLATVSGSFLDLAAVDFFGASLPRRPGESDSAFRVRFAQNLLRPRATRAALSLALTELTGQAPVIFESVRPADTGGYSVGGVGYGVAGGWGNLGLRHNSFVTVQRPPGAGIPLFAGYGTGGILFYGDLSMVTTPVTDEDIYATIIGLLPVGQTAWVRIAA